MAITKVRQEQIKGLKEKLDILKTFKEPIDLIKNLPMENNNDGDLRVCLEDGNIYIWSEEDSQWNLTSGKGGEGTYTKTLSFTIEGDDVSEINTKVRFDNTTELQTTTELINLYLNGLLVSPDNYEAKNINNELIVKWISEDKLEKDDIINIQYYDTANGIITNDKDDNYIHPSTHPVSMITGLHNCATTGDAVTLNGKSDEDFVSKEKFNTILGTNTTVIDGIAAHIEGDSTSIATDYFENLSFETPNEEILPKWVEENFSLAKGYASHIEGTDCLALDNSAHAEGYGTVARGASSHTEGGNTFAIGGGAHAEGLRTTAFGKVSHIEGYSDDIIALMIENFNEETELQEIIDTWNEKKFSLAYGEASHVEGCNNLALGEHSHAEGAQTVAYDNWSHAEGLRTTAFGKVSHIEGHSDDIIALMIKNFNEETELQEIVDTWNEKKFSLAYGYASHTEGSNNLALGDASHVEGAQTVASGVFSHAEGQQTNASNSWAHAEGTQTIASGEASHSEGMYSKAKGERSHAEGSNSTSEGICSHAEGNKTKALSVASHAEGSETVSEGDCSHTEGVNTRAIGNYSHSEGQNTVSLGADSHSEGVSGKSAASIIENLGDSTNYKIIEAWNNEHFSLAKGYASHVEGGNNLALGDASHAEGEQTVALGSDSHVEGYKTTALNNGAHAEGYSLVNALNKFNNLDKNAPNKTIINFWNDFNFNLAKDEAFHSEGRCCLALGHSSHAENYNSIADGNYSHSEGFETIASGLVSHTEGKKTTALGENSHIEGKSSNKSTLIIENLSSTTSNEDIINVWNTNKFSLAKGNNSHVEGEDNLVLGNNSHAEGYQTIASGLISHTEGNRTTAETYGLHVQGQYNKVNEGDANNYSATNNAFVIGNGTDTNALSNSFRITFDGQTFGMSAFNSTGADYAEYFEWEDGNPDNEDRIGKFVILNNDKIEIANNNEGYVLGVVSGTASIIGNAYEDTYHEMYMKDEFGRFIYEDVETENGVEKHIKLNPNYDNTKEYISRSKRKEWDAIGMFGRLIVKDDGTCKTNGYCKPSINGLATKAEKNEENSYRVIKRIKENIVEIIIK